MSQSKSNAIETALKVTRPEMELLHREKLFIEKNNVTEKKKKNNHILFIYLFALHMAN